MISGKLVSVGDFFVGKAVGYLYHFSVNGGEDLRPEGVTVFICQAIVFKQLIVLTKLYDINSILLAFDTIVMVGKPGCTCSGGYPFTLKRQVYHHTLFHTGVAVVIIIHFMKNHPQCQKGYSKNQIKNSVRFLRLKMKVIPGFRNQK